MSLIPKSIEDKGKTLTLGDVKWSESMDVDGEGSPVTRYTATASYTGTASSRYATGYTVRANYTAIFGSEKAPEESKAPDSMEDSDPAPDQMGDVASPGSTEAPDTAKEPVDLSGLKRPVMIGVVVLALAGGGVLAFKKFRERR